MKNSTQTNPLEPKKFFAQNMQWVAESVQLLKAKDISSLHLDIARREMTGLQEWYKLGVKKEFTLLDRQERKRVHQTLQVVVPAERRSAILLSKLNAEQPNPQAIELAASRLAVFLLGMVAQSSLLPDAANMRCMGATFDTILPAGLTLVHRSVALHLLRDNAELFGTCPAWVEQVVLHPQHMSAETAIKEQHQRSERQHRLTLRNKIIDLGVLTADEEQLLMRVL